MTDNPKKITTKSRQTKSAKIVALLQRNKGATIAELAKAADWQRHSVQGFMSGTLKTKRGLQITSTKEDDKDRRYRIEAGAK
jgi:hypothetical protein